mgnify:CR=1
MTRREYISTRAYHDIKRRLRTYAAFLLGGEEASALRAARCEILDCGADREQLATSCAVMLHHRGRVDRALYHAARDFAEAHAFRAEPHSASALWIHCVMQADDICGDRYEFTGGWTVFGTQVADERIGWVAYRWGEFMGRGLHHSDRDDLETDQGRRLASAFAVGTLGYLVVR